MLKKVLLILFVLIILVLFIGGLCYLKKDRVAPEFVRSVTALRLTIQNPIDKTKLTGVVEAWKKEDLSFEVPGRVEWVIEKGKNVTGAKNAFMLTHGEGELVASLDSSEYELKVKAARANVDTAKAKIAALKVIINEVLERQLDAAKADMDNEEKVYNRFYGLFKKDAIPAKTYDAAIASYKKSQAKYSESKAQIEVKKAELKGLEATLEQMKQSAADAELNLERTKLTVPYQGKIADTYVNVGANVKAGQKVVKLVVMDPVIVELNISPKLDRKLHYCQFVNIYPPGSDKPISGMINRKAAVADPNTHTFSLELLVRNRIDDFSKKLPESVNKLKEIEGTWPITGITLGGEEKLVVLADCVNKDSKGDYLWKIHDIEDSYTGVSLFNLEKVYVKVLPDEYNFLGVYKYRVLQDSGNIKLEEFVANGVPDNVKSGDEVKMIRKRRNFRPGDLVKVVLSTKNNEKGLYVPVKIISGDSVRNWVYKIKKLSNGSSVVKKVYVKTEGLFNDWMKIASPELKAGDLIVAEGAHFVVPDERVNVKSIETGEL